jgi:hypothetical protein
MSHLFKAYKEDFEIEERNTDKSRIKHYYIRNIIKRPLAMTSPATAAETEHKTPSTPTPSVPPTETAGKTANQNNRKKGRQEKKRQDKTSSEPIQNESPKVQEIQEQNAESQASAVQTPPTNMLFPSEGNKITADDVKKSQIRITKEFKPLFPTKSQKLRIMINAGEYECNFTYRGRGFHVLKLGKEAATQLGLAEGIQIQLIRLNEVSFSLQNKSV